MKANLAWLLALAFTLLGATPARAAGGDLDRYTVVGLRSAAEPGLREEVAVLRGALSLELSARGRGVVRDEEETGLRLGLRTASLQAVQDRIDAAELYFFQLELDVARRNLEAALDELAHASGVPKAWELTRAARMLLGMIQLARRDEEGRRLAAEQFAAVARVQPRWSPAEASYPAEVVELYAEARRPGDTGGRGTLRTSCEPACPGGHVYLDNFPVVFAGEAIALPPGRYQVVVTDRFEAPTRRSLLRDVVIRAGEESRIEVDLQVEGDLVAEEGPVLVVPEDADGRRQAIARVARHLRSDYVLALQAGPDASWLGWLVDGEGRILRELALPPGAQGGPEALAHLALTDALPGIHAPVASLGQGVVAARVDARAEAPSRRTAPWLTASRWSSAGLALLAGAAGGYLHLDAADRDEALRAKLDGWGGVVPSERTARATRAEADAIRAQRGWGTGMLVGAGILSATAVTLFLIDPDANDTTVRW